jgi:CheY-like chemotaxis protein
VLLVEDEVIVAMDVETIAEAAGLTVTAHAVRGSEARALFEAHRPALCLVDINLLDGPVGLDCGRQFADAGAAVVFMTANQRAVPPDFANALGVIAKPYTTAGLLAALEYVRGLVSGEPVAGPLPKALILAPQRSVSGPLRAACKSPRGAASA